jgi:hypothetical protein
MSSLLSLYWKNKDALSPVIFNFAAECVIKRVEETRAGLKLNVTRQLLAYADDVNLLRDNIDTIIKNTETLIQVIKEVNSEINVENAKYRLLSHHQNAGQYRDVIRKQNRTEMLHSSNTW